MNMKRRYYLVFGVAAIAALVSGCVGQGPDLEFTSGLCDKTVDPRETNMGVAKTEWLDDTTLVVTVYVGINCAEEIEGGGFQIFDSRIILEYTCPKCETCTFCLCAQELTYKFTNLEKKEYQFEIERIT